MLNLEGLGLTEEQMQFLGAMNNANAYEAQETEGTDPSNMSEEEMKRYSESVA